HGDGCEPARRRVRRRLEGILRAACAELDSGGHPTGRAALSALMRLEWDPFDVAVDTDPHPTWKRMRDEEPVYRNDRYDFYALSRHHDVEAAHRDPATFSSARGTVLELMGNDLSGTGQMIFLDPPEHTELRH